MTDGAGRGACMLEAARSDGAGDGYAYGQAAAVCVCLKGTQILPKK